MRIHSDGKGGVVSLINMLRKGFVFVMAVSGLTSCSFSVRGDAEQTMLTALEAVQNQSGYTLRGSWQVAFDGREPLAPYLFEGYKAEHAGWTISGQTQAAGAASANARAREGAAIGAASVPEPADSRIRSQLDQLSRLAQLPKTVAWSNELSSGGDKVVQVELAPQDARAMVEEQLKEQKNELSAQAGLVRERLAGAGSEELSAFLEASESQLEHMLSTLQAQSSVQFWLGAAGPLPKRLVVTTQMTYALQGAEQKETLVTTYQFQPSS